MYFGIKIIESDLCTMDEEVRRSWKERLFTIPWRPLMKTKTITYETMINYGGTIICHPNIAKQIREATQNKKAQT